MSFYGSDILEYVLMYMLVMFRILFGRCFYMLTKQLKHQTVCFPGESDLEVLRRFLSTMMTPAQETTASWPPAPWLDCACELLLTVGKESVATPAGTDLNLSGG